MVKPLLTAALILSLSPAVAQAQRVPFERSFDVKDAPIVDVSTIRGKIEVTVGDSGRVLVKGAATVRVGFNVPLDAPEIARDIAAHPPIVQEGNTIKLRPPAEKAQQQAVTVNYEVTVPRDAHVTTVSDSGATSVAGVSGPVAIRTQSAAIDVRDLGGTTEVKTGSGAVTADGVGGPFAVTTESSAFTGRGLKSDLRVRTGSGAVDAELAGGGSVDVQTSSSAIELQGVKSGVTASTQSGRIRIRGTSGDPWNVSTGSGAIDVALDANAILTLEATTGSGSVNVDGATVQGVVSKKRVAGAIKGGGPLMRLISRSGSIRVTLGGGHGGQQFNVFNIQHSTFNIQH
jgi:hypothetical protein